MQDNSSDLGLCGGAGEENRTLMTDDFDELPAEIDAAFRGERP
jgi:hypothetical protein